MSACGGVDCPHLLPVLLLLASPPTPPKHALQGAVDTGFIGRHEAQLLSAEPVAPAVLALAAVTWLQLAARTAQVGASMDCSK